MEGFIGEIRLWANQFAPKYWMFCEGQLLSIQRYIALFSILGTTYGGNGTTTFALPDLLGLVPVGTGQGPGLTPRQLGERIGTPTVHLTEDQLPPHRHLLPAVKAVADVGSPVGAYPAASSAIMPYDDVADVVMAPTAVGPAGDDQPHENMQPYLALRYIICVEGYFPSRW